MQYKSQSALEAKIIIGQTTDHKEER